MEKKLVGVKMELDDCAFPLLSKVVTTSKLNVGFDNIDIGLLVGSRPRSKGMERSDLLKLNGKIFVDQGKALGNHAKRTASILIVGNPANTNGLIALKNAEGLSSSNFSTMTRLDHNRMAGELANKVNAKVTDIRKIALWGNHSPTMFSDLSNTTVKGQKALSLVDRNWYENTFNPKIGKRGAAVIAARGLSSAASAANAAIDCVHDWILGSNDWKSMGILSDGTHYEIPKDLMFSCPCICENGQPKLVEGLKFDAFAKQKMAETIKELLNERSNLEDMLH